MNGGELSAEVPGTRRWAAGVILAIGWLAVVGCFVLPFDFLYGVDDYFHIAIAEKMALYGPVLESFPWATESTWLDGYFDKEWLFHLLLRCLLPLGRIGAAKAAVLLMVAMIALAWWRLFGELSIRHRFWWLLLMPIFSAGEFLNRLSLCRPHGLSIALLAVCLTLLLQRRGWALALVMAIYALSYTGHWQMVGIALIYDGLYFFLDADGNRRRSIPRALPMTIPVVAGMLLGELVHPNFPANIRGLWMQNVLVLKAYWQGGNELYSMRPQEMRPFTWLMAIAQLGPLALGLVALAVDALRRRQRWRPELWLFAMLTLVYLVMCLRSQRFIEYLVPAGLTFLALYAAQQGVWSRLSRGWRPKLVLTAVVVYCASASILGVGGSRLNSLVRLNNRPHYEDAATFLNEHLQPWEIVFTHSWSDPPILFMQAPRQRYLVFLDPFFMHACDPERFRLWKTIKNGEHPEPLRMIRDEFKARAVFLRGDEWNGQPAIYLLRVQLEQQLGAPDFISKQGDVVFLIPPEPMLPGAP